MQKKIEIFARHCYYSLNDKIPGRNRPDWFDKKLIFDNLLKTTDFNIVNLNVIYDSHFGQPANYLKRHEVNAFHIIDCGTEAKSFLKTLDIVMSKDLSDDTIVYFLEDDYIHKNNWQRALQEAFTLPGIKYATLYDHKDKRTYPF